MATVKRTPLSEKTKRWRKTLEFFESKIGMTPRIFDSYEVYEEPDEVFQFTWEGHGWLLSVGSSLGGPKAFGDWTYMYDSKEGAAPHWARLAAVRFLELIESERSH